MKIQISFIWCLGHAFETLSLRIMLVTYGSIFTELNIDRSLIEFLLKICFSALNNQLLDTYQLKSLDALVEVDLVQHELHRRIEDGRIELRRTKIDHVQERQQAVGYDHVIRCLGFKFDDSLWHR